MSAEVTVAVVDGLGWSASLLAGVVVAVAAMGWGLAEAFGSQRRVLTEVGQ